MMQIDDHLLRPSKRDTITLTVIGFGMLFAIAFVDYLTGPEIALSVFYLAPIAAVVWVAGRGMGIFISIVGAALWIFADVASGQTYSHFLIPFWNGLVRLGFFLIVTFLLSSFKKALEREKWAAMREQRRMFVVLMEQLYAPVNGILGNTALIANDDLPPATKLCLREIQQFAQKLQSVLLQLRQLPPESGFAGLNPEASKAGN